MYSILGESMTPHPIFPPSLFLYVNLVAKGAQKPPSLQYWVSLTFANAYNRTLRPIVIESQGNIQSIVFFRASGMPLP